MRYPIQGYRRSPLRAATGRSAWNDPQRAVLPQDALGRALDGLPGCIAWAAILGCFAGAVFLPKVALAGITVLAVYSAGRFLLAAAANLMGMRHIRACDQIDWHEKYRQTAGGQAMAWEAIHHVVVIPNLNEPVGLLGAALENLARSPLAASMITVVLAMEGAERGSAQKAELLRERYGMQFANFLYTLHPRNIVGETRCKSANLAWAMRWVKRKLVDKSGFDIDRIIVTTMDADTLWHPRYFCALTYFFATDPDRWRCFWQAPVRYHSNVWDISPVTRLVNAYSSAFELAYLAAPWWRAMPISSYSLSMRLLVESNYWDGDAIADEWRMYIKAFFATNMRLKMRPIYLPFLARATAGVTLREALFNRYRQTLRHAWGSKEIGYILGTIVRQSEYYSSPAAWGLFGRVTHDLLLSGAGGLLMALGAHLALALHPSLAAELVKQGWQNPVSGLLQGAFILMSLLSLVFWLQDVRLRPPRMHSPKIGENLLSAASIALLPILTVLVVALPVLHAQTLLLVGRPLKFTVSPKV